MSDDKTTPYGLWRYGNDFKRAANAVLNFHAETVFIPYYFLIGQSIELSLKGFLLGSGESLENLRTKYGHDLKKILDRALEKGMSTEVKLEQIQVGVVWSMSDEYRNKRYQYNKTGSMRLPDIQLIHETAESLSVNLEKYCYNKTKWK